jgi:hypothetical protein
MPSHNRDMYALTGMLSFLRRGGGDGSDPDLNGRHAAALDEMDRCGSGWPMLALWSIAERHKCIQLNMWPSLN